MLILNHQDVAWRFPQIATRDNMPTITARKRSFSIKTRLHLSKVEHAVVSSGMPVELFRKNLRQGKIFLDGRYKPFVDILAKKKEKSLRMEGFANAAEANHPSK